MNWAYFYMEFADKLFEYDKNRNVLIEKIQKIHEDLGINLLKLEEDDNGKSMPPIDIDPFTIFALFNRNLKDKTRIKIMKSIKKEFSIKNPVPHSLEGIPVLDSRNIRFYNFKNKRDDNEINNLWGLFENAIKLSKDDSLSQNFIFLYDKCIKVDGISWNLTTGLFWIRPFNFISLDSKIRNFIQENSTFLKINDDIKNLKNPPKGKKYLEICRKCNKILNSSDEFENFIDLSHKSYEFYKNQKSYIDNYFKKILNVYPKKIKKDKEEEKLQNWINTKFYQEFNEFLYKYVYDDLNYVMSFNSMSKNYLYKYFEIDFHNKKFPTNHYNIFNVYMIFNQHVNEIEVGLKISMSSEYTLSNRINYLSKNISQNIIKSSNNKITLKKIQFDKLNKDTIINTISTVLNIYETLIPGYIEFLKNEYRKGIDFRDDDEIKIWVMNLDNNQSNINLWEEFKKNSYITSSFIFDNNDYDFSQFNNCYALDLFFSNNIPKSEIESIWEFISNIRKNDLVILIEDNYLTGIGIVNSNFKGFDGGSLRNYYQVKWFVNLSNLKIESIFKKDNLQEMTSGQWNRLVLLLARYNKNLFEKVMEYIENLLNEFSSERQKLYNEYHNNSQYVINSWKEISNKKKDGEDISEDVWEKLINWCYNNDVKSIIKNNTNYSSKKLTDISLLFFNSIDKLIKTDDITEQEEVIKEFLEENNTDNLKFDLSNHLIKIIHYLKSDFYFIDKNIIKTLDLLYYLIGNKLNIKKSLENYLELNYEFNYYFNFIKKIDFFKKFNLDEFKDFYVFSNLLCDKNLGNLYSNEPNLFPLDIIRYNGEYTKLKFNSYLELNKKIIKFELNNFIISDNLINRICASLNSGKHIIFDGTPGTGKTELAIKFSTACEKNRFIDGYVLTTATSDWSTFDTIGGLMQNSDGSLEFNQGKFLEAIAENKWLIIDEINRADIDKAFGPLFTVLSGQDVELPYKINNQTIKIKKSDELYSRFDIKSATYFIGENWRIIGTMNVADKDSLFDLSYAFMRRFMFIDIDLPQKEEYIKLILNWANDLDKYYTEKLIQLYGIIKYRKIGPAIFKDMIEYIYYRCELDNFNSKLILSEAISSYIIPQLEGLSMEKINDIKMFFEELDLLDYIEIQLNDLLPLY